MFVITSAQKDVLDEHVREAFFEHARGFLSTRLPDARDWQDDRASLECIKEGCRVANSYGIVSEQGMVMWLYLQLVVDDKFYATPELSALFHDKHNADAAIRRLYHGLAWLEDQHAEASWPSPFL